VVQCGVAWCSVLQCDVVCCCVLQCVAVCCSVLQCVAVDILNNVVAGAQVCGAVWCNVL